MAVPAKDCYRSWKYDGPYRGGPRETLLPTLFGGEKVDAKLQKSLGHSVKYGSLGIPEPWLPAESENSTSNAACGELVGSLLGGTNLNYVGHME